MSDDSGGLRAILQSPRVPVSTWLAILQQLPADADLMFAAYVPERNLTSFLFRSNQWPKGQFGTRVPEMLVWCTCGKDGSITVELKDVP